MNRRSDKEVKILIGRLKEAVEIVERKDKKLGATLDDFISEVVVDMKIPTKQAVLWEKWFYEEY